MPLIRIFLVVFCLLLVSGCSANKKNSEKAEHLTPTEDTVATNSDTMPTPAPPPLGLPPGQAKIKGEIVKVGNQTDNRSSSYMRIRIDRVLGYGASTPPIGTSDTLNVTFRKLDQNEYKIGKIVSAVISYQQLLGDSGNSTTWTLVTLENDSK